MWHGGTCSLRVQWRERAPCRPNGLGDRLGRTLIGSALPKVLSHSRFDENDEIGVYHETRVLVPARPVSRRNHNLTHQIRPSPASSRTYFSGGARRLSAHSLPTMEHSHNAINGVKESAKHS